MSTSIPNYALYGDSAQPGWLAMVHFERIHERSSLYDFDIEPHFHDGLIQVLYVTSGGGTASIDGVSWPVHPQTLIVVPARHVHALHFTPDLLEAIRTVARGEVFLDPAATKTLLRGYLGRVRTGDEIDLGEVLSEREREVVRLTAEGHTAQQAAEILSLSPKTVETYRHRAMQKLGLTNRAELFRYALRAGLVAAEGGEEA